IPVDGGEARRVTDVPTGAMAPKWFPDSRRIAFLSRIWPELATWDEMAARQKERKDSKVSAKVWDKAPISYWDRFLDDRETHVFAIGLEGGEPTRITAGRARALSAQEPGFDSYDISPDGAEIAFAADVDDSGVDSNFDVFTLRIDGGEPRNLTESNPADDFAPLYGPDGRVLAYLSRTIPNLWDRARLLLHDRRNGETRNLTADWDRSVGGLVWSPDGNALFGSIDDAGTYRVYRFDVSGGEPKPITSESSFSGLAVAGNGPVIVALRESFIEPPTLVSIIARTGAATKLTDFNDEALAKLTQGRFESVTFKGANGEDIQMWVVYPPNFTKDRQWPLYLLLHGGPHVGIPNSVHWRWNAQVFANWGYVTAWHNFHGSSGFGDDFARSILPDWLSLPYEDTIKAAEWFASQPWIDPQRMAAGGGSYGGYLASVLLGKPHPFKTLVAHAAVYNTLTQYGADYAAGKKHFGEHWDNPEQFLTISPHTYAGNFSTPTLVIHGQNDLRVPVNHGIELFNTLQNRGVESRLVYYPDENHWILKPQNSIHWYQTKKDWLAKFVPPGPGAPAGLAQPVTGEETATEPTITEGAGE
ncbi:MAG TPA: prolyl oligopeptidase family serine peptidase, partial [Steroidobacteraceae bacterium]|nr:prolyl oligopeptidase family serine peptidase [Steroidobacteraceae bacterium]